MGFNQRQAGGKFTRDEADAFIEQLQNEAEAGPAAEVAESLTPTEPGAGRKPASQPTVAEVAPRVENRNRLT